MVPWHRDFDFALMPQLEIIHGCMNWKAQLDSITGDGRKREVIVAHWKKKILSSNRETESRDAVGTATLLLDLTVSGVSDVEPGEDIKV